MTEHSYRVVACFNSRYGRICLNFGSSVRRSSPTVFFEGCSTWFVRAEWFRVLASISMSANFIRMNHQLTLSRVGVVWAAGHSSCGAMRSGDRASIHANSPLTRSQEKRGMFDGIKQVTIKTDRYYSVG